MLICSGAQRAVRRHLQACLLSDQFQIDRARGAVAGNNAGAVGSDSVGHGEAPAVQPKTLHLLRRAMAAVTAIAKYGLDVASKVHAARCLRAERAGEKKRPERRAEIQKSQTRFMDFEPSCGHSP